MRTSHIRKSYQKENIQNQLKINQQNADKFKTKYYEIKHVELKPIINLDQIKKCYNQFIQKQQLIKDAAILFIMGQDKNSNHQIFQYLQNKHSVKDIEQTDPLLIKSQSNEEIFDNSIQALQFTLTNSIDMNNQQYNQFYIQQLPNYELSDLKLHEKDIINFMIIKNILQQAKAVFPILIINCQDIVAQTGDQLEKSINVAKMFFSNLEKEISFEVTLQIFFYGSIKEKDVIPKAIQQIHQKATQQQDMFKRKFAEYIIKRMKEKQALILNPYEDKTNSKVSSILNQIIKLPRITNPQQSLEYTMQPKTKDNIMYYCNKVYQHAKYFNEQRYFEYLRNFMGQLVEISIIFQWQDVNKVYEQAKQIVIQHIKQQISNTTQTMINSFESGIVLDDISQSAFIELFITLTQWDKWKNDHFADCDISLQQFQADLKQSLLAIINRKMEQEFTMESVNFYKQSFLTIYQLSRNSQLQQFPIIAEIEQHFIKQLNTKFQQMQDCSIQNAVQFFQIPNQDPNTNLTIDNNDKSSQYEQILQQLQQFKDIQNQFEEVKICENKLQVKLFDALQKFLNSEVNGLLKSTKEELNKSVDQLQDCFSQLANKSKLKKQSDIFSVIQVNNIVEYPLPEVKLQLLQLIINKQESYQYLMDQIKVLHQNEIINNCISKINTFLNLQFNQLVSDMDCEMLSQQIPYIKVMNKLRLINIEINNNTNESYIKFKSQLNINLNKIIKKLKSVRNDLVQQQEEQLQHSNIQVADTKLFKYIKKYLQIIKELTKLDEVFQFDQIERVYQKSIKKFTKISQEIWDYINKKFTKDIANDTEVWNKVGKSFKNMGSILQLDPQIEQDEDIIMQSKEVIQLIQDNLSKLFSNCKSLHENILQTDRNSIDIVNKLDNVMFQLQQIQHFAKINKDNRLMGQNISKQLTDVLNNEELLKEDFQKLVAKQEEVIMNVYQSEQVLKQYNYQVVKSWGTALDFFSQLCNKYSLHIVKDNQKQMNQTIYDNLKYKVQQTWNQVIEQLEEFITGQNIDQAQQVFTFIKELCHNVNLQNSHFPSWLVDVKDYNIKIQKIMNQNLDTLNEAIMKRDWPQVKIHLETAQQQKSQDSKKKYIAVFAKLEQQYEQCGKDINDQLDLYTQQTLNSHENSQQNEQICTILLEAIQTLANFNQYCGAVISLQKVEFTEQAIIPHFTEWMIKQQSLITNYCNLNELITMEKQFQKYTQIIYKVNQYFLPSFKLASHQLFKQELEQSIQTKLQQLSTCGNQIDSNTLKLTQKFISELEQLQNPMSPFSKQYQNLQENLHKWVKSVIKNNDEQFKLCIQDFNTQEAERILQQVETLNNSIPLNKFQSEIDIMSMKIQVSQCDDSTFHKLCQRMESDSDLQALQAFDDELRNQYKAKNPTLIKRLKQKLEDKFTAIIQQLQAASKSQEFANISVSLYRLQMLFVLKTIYEGDEETFRQKYCLVSLQMLGEANQFAKGILKKLNEDQGQNLEQTQISKYYSLKKILSLFQQQLPLSTMQQQQRSQLIQQQQLPAPPLDQAATEELLDIQRVRMDINSLILKFINQVMAQNPFAFLAYSSEMNQNAMQQPQQGLNIQSKTTKIQKLSPQIVESWLKSLQKIESITQFLKSESEEYLVRNCDFDQQFIQQVKKCRGLCYTDALEQLMAYLKSLEDEVYSCWDHKEYQDFAIALNVIKSFTRVVLNVKGQSQIASYQELIQYFATQINGIANDAQKMMDLQTNNLYFNKELNDLVEDLKMIKKYICNDQNQNTFVAELRSAVEANMRKIMTLLAEILEQYKNQFKKAVTIQEQSKCLIQIGKIGDKSPVFRSESQSTINDCLDHINNDETIFKLDNYFQQLNDPIGYEIVKYTPHFALVNLVEMQKLTQPQHNPQYILGNMRILLTNQQIKSIIAKQKQQQQNIVENIELGEIELSDEQKQQLSKKYEVFNATYNELVNKYSKQLSRRDEVLSRIQNLIKNKGNSLSFENWNDQAKEVTSELLALLFTYWSLLQIKDISLSDKIVFKTPHASQIFSIMLLLGFDRTDGQFQGNKIFKSPAFRSQLIQILTGEGKSIILGILASILAIIGCSVDVVCYSEYLSLRDYEDFQEFFKILNIDQLIRYATFKQLCEQIVNKDGDIRQMTLQFLQGKQDQQQQQMITLSQLQQQQQQIIKPQYKVLLVDEVDVFFSQDFYGQTYNLAAQFRSMEIKVIMEMIWVNRKRQIKEIIQMVQQCQEYQQLLKTYPDFLHFFNLHIRLMANQVKGIDEHHYENVDGRIGYKHLDQLSFTQTYGYLTNFAYFKEAEQKRVTPETLNLWTCISIACGHYSYALAPKDYKFILGVTGTLDSLHRASKDIIQNYITTFSKTPSMFGKSRLSFDQAKGVYVEMDIDSFYVQLKSMILAAYDANRPVLVFFRDNYALESYYNSSQIPFSSSKKDQLIIINQKTRDVADAVRKSTRKGQITLLERSFGRGTDFICLDKEINTKGGILVIQTFFSIDKSEEIQIRGRTARQSKEGEYKLIMFADNLIEDLQVTTEELLLQKKSMSQMYTFLDNKRDLIWGQQLDSLNQSIAKAQIKHNDTLDYHRILREYLNTNNISGGTQIQQFQALKKQVLNKLITFNKIGIQEKAANYFHFIFCLDDSGSMKSTDGGYNTRWEKLIDAIRMFVNERDKATMGADADYVSVIFHAHTSRIVVRYQKVNNLLSELSKNTPCYGGNSFYQAIDDVTKLIKEEPKEVSFADQKLKKIILFLSDGGDCERDKTKLSKSLQNLKNQYQSQISNWWNMGFGPSAEASVLNQMTVEMAECGGQYKTALNATELEEEFGNLAAIEPQNI